MKTDYRDYVLDLLQPHGPISARPLFGGYGIYYESLIIGIIVDSQLYFKVNDETRSDYEAYGSLPFVYDGKSKTVTMSYMTVPESILEKRDELSQWIEKAHQVSLQSAKSKKNKSNRSKKSHQATLG